MNPQVAVDAARNAEPDALADALIALSEKQRRALYEELREITHLGAQESRTNPPLNRCFLITIWGTGTSRDVANASVFLRFVSDRRIADVVSARPRRTIEALAKGALRDNWDRTHWFVIRDLIRAGTIEHPDNEAYYSSLVRSLSMVFGGGDSWRDAGHVAATIVGRLRDDAELPAELVAATSYEEAVNTLSGSYVAKGWLPAFKEAVAEELLDRSEILDLCLNAQLRDFRKSASAFFRKLWEHLEPTMDERVDRADTLVRILAAAQPSEQAAAAKDLGKLVAGGYSIDGPAVASAVVGPLNGTHKGAAMAALRLVGASPMPPAEKARAAGNGLGHAHADVQRLAMEIMESAGDALPSEVRADAMLWVDSVAPAHRQRLIDLVGVDVERDAAVATVPDADLETRLAAVAGSSLGESNLLGLIDAARRGELPGPLEFDAMSLELPRDPLRPIADVDELVERVTSLLAGSGSPIDLELVVDGLARFDPASIPGNAMSSMRAALDPTRSPDRWHLWDSSSLVDVAVRFWCARKTPRMLPFLSPNKRLLRRRPGLSHDLVTPPKDTEGYWWMHAFDGSVVQAGTLGFLSARFWEAVTVGNTKPHPTLALPSSTDGWLEPGDLVRRLAQRRERGISPGRFDVVQALFRLRPGELEEDDRRYLAASPVVGPAIRLVLGEEVAVDDEGLAGAATAAPAVTDLRLVSFPKDGHKPAIDVLRFGVDGPPPTLRRDDPIGQLIGEFTDAKKRPRNLGRWWGSNMAMAPFDRQMVNWTWIGFPRHRGIVAARAASLMAEDLDANRSSDTFHSLLAATTDPDVALTFAQHVLLAAGLADRNVITSSAAADLLHDAAIDGRLDSGLLGATLGRLSNGGIIKASRFAKASATVAAASPLVAERVRQVLCAWLGTVDGVPRDLHTVLETLELACSESGSGVRETGARGKLTAAMSGSSKRAKSARRLLELAQDPSTRAVEEATVNLVGRAERWAAGHAD